MKTKPIDTGLRFSILHSTQNNYDKDGTHFIVQTIFENGVSKDSVLMKIPNESIITKNPFDLTWMQDSPVIEKTGSRVRVKSVRYLNNDYVFSIKHGPLYCLNQQGNFKWINSDYIFHHSIEIDSASNNIWACGLKVPINIDYENQLDHYNSIPAVAVKISGNTGKTIWSKKIADIIDKTQQLRHISKYEGLGSAKDVWHLNDVQPSPYDSSIIALSLRDINSILLYDYINDSIIYEHYKPSFQQHDVDFLSDSVLAVYSNNYGISTVNSINRINMVSRKIDTLAYNLFEEHNIFTSRQGLFELRDSLLFVEETSKSLLHIINVKNNKLLGQYNFSSTNYPMPAFGSWIQINYPFK